MITTTSTVATIIIIIIIFRLLVRHKPFYNSRSPLCREVKFYGNNLSLFVSYKVSSINITNKQERRDNVTGHERNKLLCLVKEESQAPRVFSFHLFYDSRGNPERGFPNLLSYDSFC